MFSRQDDGDVLPPKFLISQDMSETKKENLAMVLIAPRKQHENMHINDPVWRLTSA